MTSGVAFDKIDLSLIRAFHTVITERSVSRAALRLSTSQPAVSGQLKRLRGLIGDPLLVRAGAGTHREVLDTLDPRCITCARRMPPRAIITSQSTCGGFVAPWTAESSAA
jgi:hypothetical protein